MLSTFKSSIGLALWVGRGQRGRERGEDRGTAGCPVYTLSHSFLRHGLIFGHGLVLYEFTFAASSAQALLRNLCLYLVSIPSITGIP